MAIHPFHEGYRDHMAGLAEWDNPYPNDQPYGRAAWRHGWDTAAEDLEGDDG